MIILKEKKTKRLFDIASTILEQEIEDLKEKKQVITIGVVGGSVTKFYEHLSRNMQKQTGVEIFLLDERITPFSPLRNYPKIKKSLSNLFSVQGIHEINQKANPLITAQEYYELLLSKNKKGFDIIILSAGSEGHVASIFPRKNYSTKKYVFIEDSPKKPRNRITATKELMSASKICFTFFLGESKKNLLREFQEGDLDENEFPVKFVKKIKKSYVFSNIK